MKFHRAWMPLSLLTLAGCSSIPWVETDRPNCVADVFFPVKYERVMWSGQCSNGKVNGQGTLVSSSGTRLEGTFHDGIVQMRRVEYLSPDSTAKEFWSVPPSRTAEEISII